MRNARLEHLDAELAPTPTNAWAARKRQWWLFALVPLMPLAGLAVLAWGTVMFGVGMVAGAGRLLWEVLPASGTTRRSLRRLWSAWRRSRGVALDGLD